MAIARPLVQQFETSQLRIPRRSELPSDGLGFRYDRTLDTLYAVFYGRSLPSLTEHLDRGDRDFFALRIELPSLRVTGLQIDDFLAYAVIHDPWLGDALLIAEYPDSTPEQNAAIRKQAAERITQPWSDERFLDQLRRVVTG